MCSVVFRLTTNKTVKRHILKNSINKSIRNPKKCSSIPQEGKQRETVEQQMGNKQNTNNRKAGLSSNIPIITLSINGLNTPIKRQRLVDRTDPPIYPPPHKKPLNSTA